MPVEQWNIRSFRKTPLMCATSTLWGSVGNALQQEQLEMLSAWRAKHRGPSQLCWFWLTSKADKDELLNLSSSDERSQQMISKS